MNRKNEIAMFAGKNKRLLSSKHLEKLQDNEIKIGSKSFCSEATPKQYDVKGNPLPTYYSQDWHHDLVASGRDKSQGFVTKIQHGTPKLNKKHWYKIQYNDQLAGVASKKALSGFAGGNGSWQKAKDGVYWSHGGDDAIMLIRGDLITQKELEEYYINRIRGARKDDPFNEYHQMQQHPFKDTIHICKKCGISKSMSGECKMCSQGRK